MLAQATPLLREVTTDLGLLRVSGDGALDLGFDRSDLETTEEMPKGARWAPKLQMS